MNGADARWTVQQIEALAGALARELERLVGALEGASPPALEGARLALDDARRMEQRVHYIRREVEAHVPPAV